MAPSSVFSYTLENTIKGRKRKSIADEIVPWKGEMTVNPLDFLPLYVSTHNTGKWHSEPLINLLFALCRFKSTIITQFETQKTPE
jgi:hypothetical protein